MAGVGLAFALRRSVVLPCCTTQQAMAGRAHVYDVPLGSEARPSMPHRLACIRTAARHRVSARSARISAVLPYFVQVVRGQQGNLTCVIGNQIVSASGDCHVYMIAM